MPIVARVNPEKLAKTFLAAASGFEARARRELKRVGMEVRKTSMLKFGKYQPAVGPFPAWKSLALYTIRMKAAAGGAEDPLIGHYTKKRQNKVWPAHLRNTIEVYVEGLQMAVGTRDPLGPIHEFGTRRIPPRPFLRPAAWQCETYFFDRMKVVVEETIRTMSWM